MMIKEKSVPSIDDLINLPLAEDAQISPDGSLVAYTLSEADWEANERVSQIWLAEVKNLQPRQLTFTKAGSYFPRWSADGKWLAFLSKRPGDAYPQVYRISPLGGEAEKLTDVVEEISHLAWSPAGDVLAFIMQEPETQQLKERLEKYGDFREEDKDFRRSFLWLFDLQTRKLKKLAGDESLHVLNFDWSVDGDRILFQAAFSPDVKDEPESCIYHLDVKTLESTCLTDKGAASPFWSPDGTEFVYSRYQPEGGYYRDKQICIHTLNGGDTRVLPLKLSGNPFLCAWGKDGIFFASLVRSEIHLFRVQPASGDLQQLTPSDRKGWMSLECSFDAACSKAAFAYCDAVDYYEVGVLDLENNNLECLTTFNEKIKDWQVPEKEEVKWTSQDGTTIQGVLTRPLDFDPQKKYPLLVIIHGGPTWASSLGKLAGPERRFYPALQWLQKGALILEPNYRGSDGFGEDFRSLNLRNLGLGDYQDVISGVDYLIEKGWADPEKVGVMGWSQGGYISAFISTYSDRFKAASVGAGISNWVTYYVNTDIHPFTRQYLAATPWEDMEIYQKTSPMTYIQNACTPTLIQHGEKDQRVPPPNAFELYQGLQDQGVETKLLIYKDMPHGTTRPRLQRQIMQSNYDWFNRWIFGKETPEDMEPPCYLALSNTTMLKDPETLAAIRRFSGAAVQDVYHWSRRDRTRFLIFSARFGLVEEDFPMPQEESALFPEDVSRMAVYLAGQLRDFGIRKVVFFTPQLKENPWVRIYLGCLQVAAGMLGNIELEHKEVNEEGW